MTTVLAATTALSFLGATLSAYVLGRRHSAVTVHVLEFRVASLQRQLRDADAAMRMLSEGQVAALDAAPPAVKLDREFVHGVANALAEAGAKKGDR